MKTLLIVVTLALVATPSYAQSASVYASVAGGFAVSPDGTSGDANGEIGFRIAPHLSVFGDVGQFHISSRRRSSRRSTAPTRLSLRAV